MREFSVYAPAKLNLYLNVLDKRPDGFHNIETLFEKIDLKDEIVVREKTKGIDVKAEPLNACPSGKDNIAYKAAQALVKETGVNLGLDILIKKNIPVAAGLGGGSSNAASLLLSLNKIFELGVSFERLVSIGSAIGKDVPFFMLDAIFAKGTARGEILEPIDTDLCLFHVVVKPNIALSTAQMYERIDTCKARSKNKAIEKTISAAKDKNIELLQRSYFNIFEEVLGDHAPHIEKAKSLLNNAGAGPVFLSGSGPSVFCIVSEREEAAEIFDRIPKGSGIEVFLASSYKGGMYGDN